MIEEFKRLRIVAYILRICHPFNGTCKICGLPWSMCEIKSVTHPDECSGTFATCKYCWDKSSLAEILDAYKQTHKMQSLSLERYNKESGKNLKMYCTLPQLIDCVERDYKSINN